MLDRPKKVARIRAPRSPLCSVPSTCRVSSLMGMFWASSTRRTMPASLQRSGAGAKKLRGDIGLRPSPAADTGSEAGK